MLTNLIRKLLRRRGWEDCERDGVLHWPSVGSRWLYLRSSATWRTEGYARQLRLSTFPIRGLSKCFSRILFWEIRTFMIKYTLKFVDVSGRMRYSSKHSYCAVCWVRIATTVLAWLFMKSKTTDTSCRSGFRYQLNAQWGRDGMWPCLSPVARRS